MTLVVNTVKGETTVDERNGPEAVDLVPTVVACEKVLETEVVAVAAGLNVKRPILFPYFSAKWT